MRKYVLALMLFVSSISHGAIIDNGSYFTDTNSGIDWLDLTPTVGLSVFEVQDQMGVGGAFDGWQFATESLFVDLAISQGAALDPCGSSDYLSVCRSSPEYADSASYLMGLFGVTSEHPRGDQSLGLLAGNRELFQVAQISNIDTGDPHRGVHGSFNAYEQSWEIAARPGIGVFLVRGNGLPAPISIDPVLGVPEPATLPILFAGLAVFGLKRHRRKYYFKL